MEANFILQHEEENKQIDLKYVESLYDLHSSRIFVYKITHILNTSLDDIFIRTTINRATFDILLAHIQFQGSEINYSVALSQKEVGFYLKTFYKVDIIQATEYFHCEFDLHDNFDKWCDYTDRIMALELLYKERLVTHLKGYIGTN